MSTLDEITKEKERVSEALARVNAQREKLATQHAELDATERVLARYTKGAPARRTGSVRAATSKAAAPAQSRRRSRAQPVAGRPRRASAIRSLPWQMAKRSRKSPLHAKGFAPTMSASPSPD